MPGPIEQPSILTQPMPTGIVTPQVGPPQQEPPRPVVVQNALVGMGTTAAMNTMTAGFSGEPSVMTLAGGLNLWAQIVKQIPQFNEKDWTLPLLLVSGILLSTYIWVWREGGIVVHNWTDYLPNGKALINGMGSAFQAAVNYHGLAATGVSPLKPVAYERSAEAKLASPAAVAA